MENIKEILLLVALLSPISIGITELFKRWFKVKGTVWPYIISAFASFGGAVFVWDMGIPIFIGVALVIFLTINGVYKALH